MSHDAKTPPVRMPSPSNQFEHSLKSVRYEETEDALPPLSVPSLKASTRASAIVSDELKRDSAISANIPPLHDRPQHFETVLLASNTSARCPSVPSIIVQEEHLHKDDVHENPCEHIYRPTARSSSVQGPRERPMHAPIMVRRANSVEDMKIRPSYASIDDIGFEDLLSDKLTFSKRGSLLFGGHTVTDLDMAHDQRDDPTTTTSGQPLDRISQVESGVDLDHLAAGRTTPGVQLPQALNNGRVLSPEEITFSSKVRNMYKYGEELTPRPSQGESTNEERRSKEEEEEEEDRDTIAPMLQDNVSSLLGHAETASLRPATSNSKRGSMIKEATEIAGGMEDWDDVYGPEVDRYGFIRPRTVISTPEDRMEGVQRVATSLRLQSDQMRQDRRSRSVMSRSSRSAPPSGGNRRAVSIRSVGSHTTVRSVNKVLQSMRNRTLAEAGDMLTLPPGLADIAEQEDAGRTASSMKRREWSREEKWRKMAKVQLTKGKTPKGGGMRFEFEADDAKVISRTWKGIPDRWRATAWHSFLSTSARKRGAHSTEDELREFFNRSQDASSPDDVQIDLDVPRTINMHIMFRRRYRGGQRLLFRVLHAISLQFPDVGYVQGMGSLAATLLCYYDEEMAFVMMVRLWQLRGLEQLFQDGFRGLMAALDEFEREWLGGGELAKKLETLGITSTAYGTRWYLTLFNMSIPFPAQLRVWDVFMLLGDGNATNKSQAYGGADLDVLHATSAALVDATQEIVLDSDFENVMKVLTSFIPIKDEDLLMRVAKTEWRMRKKRSGIKG